MKFRTFRVAALGGAVVLGGGGVYLATRHSGESVEKVQPTRQAAPIPPPTPEPPPKPTPTPTPTPPPTPTPTPTSLRPVDQDILARIKTPLSSDKATDVFPGKPYNVNLYQDAGHPAINRLKIDLDRDRKWDEKWTIAPDGKIKRQVAPADDERYTDTYTLDSAGWKRKD